MASKSQSKNTTAAPVQKTGGSNIFRKPKDDKRSALTSERIANDLVAFERAGGKIEVLGTTRTLKSIPPPEAAAESTAKPKAESKKPESKKPESKKPESKK